MSNQVKIWQAKTWHQPSLLEKAVNHPAAPWVAIGVGALLGLALCLPHIQPSPPSIAPLRAPEPRVDAPAEPAATAASKAETCLAEVVYYEARGESAIGQRAVADVVMRRLERRWRGEGDGLRRRP